MAEMITISGTNVKGYVLPAKITEIQFPIKLKFAPNYKPIIRRKAVTQSGSGTMTNYFEVTDNRKEFEIVASENNYLVSKDGVFINFVPNGGSAQKRYMVYEPVSALPTTTVNQAGFSFNSDLLLLGSWGAFAYLVNQHNKTKKKKKKFPPVLIAFGLLNVVWSYRVFFKSN